MPVPVAWPATRGIMIVFVNAIDRVEAGFIASLPPGGNPQGSNTASPAIRLSYSSKSRLRRGCTCSSAPRPTRGQLGVVEPATASLEVILTRAKHATRGGTQCAIAAIAGNPNGLVVIASGLSVHCDPFIALAFRYRLSAVYPFPYNVSAGGLICRLPPRPNWLSVLRFTVCVTCKSAQESGLAL